MMDQILAAQAVSFDDMDCHASACGNMLISSLSWFHGVSVTVCV
jgi:hypothetical protein